jgi:hypothetical protein
MTVVGAAQFKRSVATGATPTAPKIQEEKEDSWCR